MPFLTFIEITQSAAFWFVRWSWLIIFFVLLVTVPAFWLAYVQERFRRQHKYVLLEFRLPRLVTQSPRAMEQAFTAINALRNNPDNWQEKWLDGEITLHYSFEVASFGGEVHFYVWIPEIRRNMVEAALYASYPDLELTEVQDYARRLPPTYDELNASGYQLFGNELKLSKDDVYPIRSYMDFEASIEEKEVDPIAGLIEILGVIKPQEQLWLQIIAQPLAFSWDIKGFTDAGVKEVDRIKERARFVRDPATRQPIRDPETGFPLLSMPSPGETEAMKGIDRNISKPAFFTVIRYLYIAPKEMFNSGFGQRGVYSALNQYATESFNKFRHNWSVWTKANMWYYPYIFPKRRLLGLRRRIWWRYRERRTYDDTAIAKAMQIRWFNLGKGGVRITLNTEELATIFHLPTKIVLTGPMVKTAEARKAGPPAGLGIYGEEEKE